MEAKMYQNSQTNEIVNICINKFGCMNVYNVVRNEKGNVVIIKSMLKEEFKRNFKPVK